MDNNKKREGKTAIFTSNGFIESNTGKGLYSDDSILHQLLKMNNEEFENLTEQEIGEYLCIINNEIPIIELKRCYIDNARNFGATEEELIELSKEMASCDDMTFRIKRIMSTLNNTTLEQKKMMLNTFRVNNTLKEVVSYYNNILPSTKVKYNNKTNSIQLIKCGSCNNTGKHLLLCSRCKMVYYCNTICQKDDYSQHKKLCKSINK